MTGQAFLVEDNIQVLVLDRGFLDAKVRMLEGSHYGEVVWVPSEWGMDEEYLERFV